MFLNKPKISPWQRQMLRTLSQGLGGITASPGTRDTTTSEFILTGPDIRSIKLTFDRKAHITLINEFHLHDKSRGYGLGGRIAGNIAAFTRAGGGHLIKLTAVKEGAYVWARAGWVPTEDALRSRLFDGETREVIASRYHALRAAQPKLIDKKIKQAIEFHRPENVWTIVDAAKSVPRELAERFNDHALRPGMDTVTLGRVLTVKTAWDGILDLDGPPAALERFARFTGRKTP